jgi:5-amino-6-(5-phosphoribosylamino)uracil reductase
VHLLHPHPGQVTIAEAYDLSGRRRHPDRPWVVMSMIATGDGAVAIEGASHLLGGPADRDVFLHLHRSADTVFVGAETVRADGYSPLPSHQTLVVMSSSGDLGRHHDALLAAGNTRVVAGDVRDVVSTLPGEVCALEGGPSLNGQMLGADLVDEVWLTVAPRFVAGRSDRLAEGAWAMREPWHLAHVAHDAGFVFLRYLRDAESGE